MALKITKNQGSIQVTADKSGFYPFDGTITFPTNSLFTATSANTDMITFKSTSNGDVQFVGNYKDITISGRSYDTKQKFLTAFSNLANQGSVDAYTKAETDAKIDAKQGKLKAGNGITLTEDATDNTTVVKTAVSLTDNGNGAYTVGDSIEIDPYKTVRIGGNTSSGSGTRASVVIGDNASITGICNVAVGDSAAGNNSSIAVGYRATTIGDKSTAIGYSARAGQVNAVAIGTDADASEDNPLVINAGYKTVDNVKKPLTVLQSDSNGKISLLKGDGTIERMVIQDEIEALKNAGGSGGGANPLVNVKGTGSATITDTVTDGIAIGSGASVTNDSCIAIGKDTSAQAPTGQSSIVIGSGAKVAEPYADGIVIGSGAKVDDGSDSIVIGNKASSETSSDSVVIGHATYSKQSKGIAIGRGAGASADDKVDNSDSIAIGTFARADGVDSIAIGHYSTGEEGGVAMGKSSKANAEKGIAIGNNAMASVVNGVAIGELARTAPDKPLVINAGNKTVIGRKQPITMIQGDANGKISLLKGDGTDERMVIQDEIEALKNAGGGTVDAYTKVETDTKLEAKQDKLTAGSGITITKDETAGTSTIATAVSLTDNGNGAYQVGGSIKINSNSIAIGKYAYSYGRNSVAVGSDAQASGDGVVAIGHYSVATEDTPLVIRAGYKIVGNSEKNLTVLQSDANGKISIIKGDDPDERIVISDEITALKAEITTLKAEIAALKGGA